jgi:hypothetical protein
LQGGERVIGIEVGQAAHAPPFPGVPWFTGAEEVELLGKDAVQAVSFRAGGVSNRIDAGHVLLHHGVIPLAPRRDPRLAAISCGAHLRPSKAVPLAKTAQAVRAILLASAATATLK